MLFYYSYVLITWQCTKFKSEFCKMYPSFGFYVCTMNPSFVFSGLLCVNESDVTFDYSIILLLLLLFIYLFVFSVKG